MKRETKSIIPLCHIGMSVCHLLVDFQYHSRQADLSFGMVLPAAVILFPVAYIFGDILTEVYGFKRSRLIIWTGFACNLLMAAVLCWS